jgi:hypothetical protein
MLLQWKCKRNYILLVCVGFLPKLPSIEIFLKLEFSRQSFEKYSNIFHENPTVGTELFHADGQTEKRDEASNCFSEFCERA